MKDHICGKVIDYCMCGTTKILFCIYCRDVVGYQKQSEDMRISISIMSDLMTDKQYSKEVLEANK